MNLVPRYCQSCWLPEGNHPRCKPVGVCGAAELRQEVIDDADGLRHTHPARMALLVKRICDLEFKHSPEQREAVAQEVIGSISAHSPTGKIPGTPL